MDRNTITGLVLVAVIIIGYMMFFAPKPPEETETTTGETVDSVGQPETQDTIVPAVASNDSIPVSSGFDSVLNELNQKKFGIFAPYSKGEETFVTIENEKLKIVLTSKGGRVYSVELKDYQTYDSLSLILFTGDENEFNYLFPVENKIINSAELYFNDIRGSSFLVEGDESKSVGMRVSLDDNHYIEQFYSLEGEGNFLNYELRLVGMDELIPRNGDLILSWKIKLLKQEQNLKQERIASKIYYKYLNDDDVDWLSERKDDEETVKTAVHWIGFKQKFFVSALINDTGFPELELAVTTDKSSEIYVKEMEATDMAMSYKQLPDEHIPLRFYFGPTHYKTLKKAGIRLEKTVPLGWGIFGWVNKYFIIPIFNALDNRGLNYGIIILILTIIIKLVVSPLTYKSYLSQAKMSLLKPEIEELKKKYNNDQSKVSPEQLKLFQRAGVNPLGGCLPLLLQMPILIAMYRFFPTSFELRQQSFLWATDLSTYDSIYTFPNGFSLPFYGDHISLFTLLMSASTLIYAHMNSQMTATTNQQMKVMQYLFPIMMIFIFNNFSSALTYYYFMFNVLGFIQQWIMKKYIVSEDKLRAQMAERKSKPRKKSGFVRRLEEAAKARQKRR